MITGQVGKGDREYKANSSRPKTAPFRNPTAFFLLKILYLFYFRKWVNQTQNSLLSIRVQKVTLEN